jgi:hypothetical protein
MFEVAQLGDYRLIVPVYTKLKVCLSLQIETLCAFDSFIPWIEERRAVQTEREMI